MDRLSDPEIAARVAALNGWHRQGDAIQKQYAFPGFPDAIAFVNRVAEQAEAADHHPDIAISYRKVTLTFETHSAGGLTTKDFDGAAAADRLVP